RTADHDPSHGGQSARRVSDGLDQGRSVGDVEGNAVRPHHGPDDVDGEIRVEGSSGEKGRRQEIDAARRDRVAAPLRLAPKRAATRSCSWKAPPRNSDSWPLGAPVPGYCFWTSTRPCAFVKTR